uniref:Retrovirus-related Pol polyprotein from transposon TNT 1-94 n=1 Tax=Tanacetum cinerariifolium TaxID=118510 RepID=A0A699IDU2_TANCI|nr:retrovirus-related Pol polyprotein from transposon TNT 1-94 [Tanacetum cinerariifolium]
MDEVSYHKLFDILKQYQNEVNKLRAEKLARNANPLALIATTQASQDPFYQSSRSHRSQTPSPKPSISSISHTSTRHKGKEIAMPITPPSETASKKDSDPKQAQKDKDMQKNLALIAKYFKKIYKPTNNNLKTSSNSKDKNVDMTLRYKNDDHSGQFGTRRIVNVAGTREKVGSQVVQKSRIQCFNYKEYGHFAKECRKPKRVKDSAYHKEKMLLCKQAEQDSGADSEPVEQVQNDVVYNVFANALQHSEQSESVSNTCLVETNDSNVTPESPDMCEDDIQNEQNDIESDDERVALANLTANLKLDTKQIEFEKYKAFNDRTVDYDKIERKLDEALGQIAHKDTVIRECLKTIAYELSVVKEKHDELMKQCLLTNSHYEGLVKQKTKQEMHADLKYVESLKKEIDELESEKAEFSDMYNVILHDCVSKDVMCFYLQSLSDLDVLAELQCMYLHKVKECGCLAQKHSKQTESVSKKVHTKLLQHFAKVEKHSISLEIALQNCKEQGKSMDTKFDRPSVVRQPNAQRIPKPSVLGKPTPFLDSLKRRYFPKTRSVPKTNVSEGLSKPVTAQILPQAAKKAMSNTNVLRPRMYRIDNRTAHTRAPQLSQTVRNTNLRVSTSIGVNHKPTVSRPQLKSNQLKDKIVRLILFIVDSGCTKHMTGNLKLLCNFVEKFMGTVRFGNEQFTLILGYGDLVQGNVTINRVYYVEGLNHNLFSVGQFCDADLEVAFRKSTCFVGDLQGNDLLTGKRGSNLYTISHQESTSSTPLCLMAKATPTQAWLWHRRLSHLNFDYINLLSKKDIVIGLPKLKYIACINGKKYILVIVDDFSRYTLTLFLRSKDETPEVLKDFLTMLQRNLQAPVITVHAHVPSQQELDLLFGPLYDEFFNAGSNPSTNIQSTSAPSTNTNVHAEENNNNQAEEGEQLQDDEFTNPLYAPAQEEAESSSHNIGNTNVPTFNQPHVFEYRWTKDHPLDQVRGNPSRPVQTRRKLATDPEMCMFALTVSTVEPKNNKDAMADYAWIEAMQEELHQFDRLQFWELADKPYGKSIIRLKWLWKNKKDEDQTVIRNKPDL